MNKIANFDEEFLTPDDICKILKIGKAKCLKLFHSEDFPSQNLGKKFLISKEAFKNYLLLKHTLKKEDLICTIKPS